MGVYLICFFLTIAFAAANEHFLSVKKGNIALAILSAALVVLIPSALAGFRDFEIGTDVLVYAKSIFESALRCKDFSSLQKIHGGMEIGFLGLAYFISRFTYDMHWFLFSISLFINAFVYLGLFRFRRKSCIWIGELVFLFCCYNETFNMMRQCMAMAIMLFSLTFLFERKYITYVGLIAFASLFHQSIFIAFLFIFLYVFLNNGNRTQDANSKKKYTLRLIVCFVATIFATFFFIKIGSFFLSNGLITDKYSRYLSSNEMNGGSIKSFVFYAISYVFLFYSRKKMHNPYVFLAIGLIDLACYPLRLIMPFLYRISSFFFYCRILSFSQLKVDLFTKKSLVLKREEIASIGISYRGSF